MKIKSTNIKEANYDRNTQVMSVLFIKRPLWLYEYQKVPPQLWVAFCRAESKGKYFRERIKDNFRYKVLYIRGK